MGAFRIRTARRLRARRPERRRGRGRLTHHVHQESLQAGTALNRRIQRQCRPIDLIADSCAQAHVPWRDDDY
jgi:hypothetical protein